MTYCVAGQFNYYDAELSIAEMDPSFCQPCATGKSQRATGQVECEVCEEGKFQTEPGQSSCVSCAVNKNSYFFVFKLF